MHSYTKGAAALLSIMGFTVVWGCRDAGGPDAVLTAAQVAGTYALQTYDGESLPLVVHSTYEGTFVDDAGFWIPAPITIDDSGLLTLRTYYTVTFLGPKDPPGTYTAYPADQQIAPRFPRVFAGSIVVNADGTCAVTFWENTSLGVCGLTHDLLEWTGASLVLTEGGKWMLEKTVRDEHGAYTTTVTQTGSFTVEGDRIVLTPAGPIAPDCPTTATLAGDVLTTVTQCPAPALLQGASVWQR